MAHQLRDSRKVDLSAVAHTNETYDLVIVGGGMSGLGAAYYFLKNAGRDARVLILDNHDDFGGHAKRNEFRHNGRLLAINGGTLNIEAPQRYNEAAKELLLSIGIDLDRYQSSNATNHNLYRSLGLGRGHFFDKETWGADHLVGALGRRFSSRELAASTPRSSSPRRRSRSKRGRTCCVSTTSSSPITCPACPRPTRKCVWRR